MLGDSLTVLLIGLSVVFLGLLSLIGIIHLMSFIVRLVRREERPAKKRIEGDTPVPGPSAIPAPQTALSGASRRETVAAISAAIAETMGADVSAIRIKSIRRVGAAPAEDRRMLIAAVSAAVAETMGADVSAIRIKSIRRLG